MNLTWKNIGFGREKVLSGFILGALLFTVTYFMAYLVEIIILKSAGEVVKIEFYSTGFSLTGAVVKNTAFYFVVFTILANLINSWMEEGVFRGLFLKFAGAKYSFPTANTIQALFFGLWHIVMPIRSVIDGEMDVSTAIIMSIGYILLSLMMGAKLGMLTLYSGSIWAGFFEHTLNNSVVNLVHITTNSGIDTMQIVRVILAQVLSLIIVYIYSLKKRKQMNGPLSIEG